ncbi:hypothetical protein CERSUDRAFT_96497 [Gelatoporia subvermispora B]|uniref:Uncharacterized protein n=1 Tax=Ceriporiopsis subvermispora (strain B) TaxID=914234 RepID=M2R9F4_CERS8|nr:hypothetical protein CERSUDRAFT_96497 [Gelatoporia subvermispora B]
MAEAPRQLQVALAHGRDTARYPLAEEVSQEFALFAMKFYNIFREAYCRSIETPESRGKGRFILGIDAERIPSPSLSSRPWTRFRINSARCMTPTEVPSFLGPDFNAQELLAKIAPTFDYFEQKNRPDEDEFIGIYLLRGVFKTLSGIVPVCGCTQFPIYSVPTADVLAGKVPMSSVIGAPDPSTESTSTSLRRQTWEQDLIAKVERLCGRAYIEETLSQ